MKQIKLCASDFLIIQGKIWFVPLNYPVLICYDLDEAKIEKVLKLNNESYVFVGFYEKLLMIDNKIIGIPYQSKKVFVYSIDDDRLEYIDLPEQMKGSTPGFYLSRTYKRYIYAFPRCVGEIDALRNYVLKIDIEQKKTEVIAVKELSDDYDKKIPPAHSAYRRSSTMCNDEIIMINGLHNAICSFSCEEERIQSYSINYNGGNITIIDEDIPEERFIIVDDLDNIMLWNRKDNSVNRIGMDIAEIDTVPIEDRDLFYEKFEYSIRYGDRTFLFPYLANRIVELTHSDNTFRFPSFGGEICEDAINISAEHEYNCGHFSEPHIIDDSLYVWNLWTKELCRVDLKNNKVSKFEIFLTLTKRESADAFGKYMRGNEMVEEKGDSQINGLEGFLDYVSIQG